MKDELRHQIWSAMEREGAARFPGARGRIPNFAGAQAAAQRLAETAPFRQAAVIKCNPDTPQRPVRAAALRAGKLLYMAVPKLADTHPFLELDPARIPVDRMWEAASKAGAERWGEPVAVSDMREVDLIVTGCVAVAPDGARLGKGGGYSDIEFALLMEAGRVSADTPVMSTVHPLQEVEPGRIAMVEHDISLDGYCTPTRAIACPRAFQRPTRVMDEVLAAEKRAGIPVLRDRSMG